MNVVKLIQDASLLFPDWFPVSDLPDAGGVLDHVTLSQFREEWTADTVTLTAHAEVDTDVTADLFGFEVGFGDPDAETTTAELAITLESEPVLTAIGVLVVAGELATAEDVADAAQELDVPFGETPDYEALANQDDPPDLGAIRVELSGLRAHVCLPEDTFQVGELVEQDGDVVGIDPDPDDPRAVVDLATITLWADTDAGVGIDVETPDAISLPPLLFRDTDVGLILEDLTPDFSTTSTPQPVIDAGYDDAWRGLYIGEVTIWGLDSWLPFLPEGVHSAAASGTRLTFEDWFIDQRGFTGSMTLDLPDEEPGDDSIWSLDSMTLAFEHDWIPAQLRATVDLALAKLSPDLDAIGSDGDVTLVAELRYNPDRPAAARFGFDIVAKAEEDGPLLDLTSDELGASRTVLFAALGALAAAGGTESAIVAGALATLEAADLLETNRLAIDNLALGYDVEQRGNGWARVISADLDLVTEFVLALEDAGDSTSSSGEGQKGVNTPLGLKARNLTIEYVLNHEAVGVDPVTVAWDFEDTEVSLQADASIGDAVTISSVSFRTDGTALVIELGIETEGSGDVAIAGVPDAIIITVDGDDVSVSFGGGIPTTLLIPGVLYGTGELHTGDDAGLPPAGDGLSWESAMVGSLRGFLIGNGTAAKPADYKKRASYMLGLDLGLLTAKRSDGMTTVVVSIDTTFNPGIPLGTSGLGLYGLGLLYGQNAQPALPAPDDYAGWYMDESPEFTTHAKKWEPALDAWGFGASTVIGSAPDNAKSWSAKVGLIVLIPGPVIILAGKGDAFSEKPSLGGGDQPPFAAVVVLDLEDDFLSVDLRIRLEVPAAKSENDPKAGKLATVTIPTEIFVDLQDATNFHLYMGQYAPDTDRVVVEALGLLDLSAYLMLDGSPIRGLPTVDPLPGLALALGGEATVDWGLKSDVLKCYWYAEATFDLGVSLADPALLIGIIEIEGGLVVKVFGFGFDLGVYARMAGKAPDPFELTGEVGVNLDLPWPFDDIHTSVTVSFGPGGTLPDAPDPFVELSLRPRRRKDARTISEDGESKVPEVPVDPVFALAFDAPVGNDGGTIDSFVTGGDDYDQRKQPRVWKVVTTEKAEKAGVKRRHRIGYRYELTGLTLTDESGATVTGLPAAWPPGTAGGEPGTTGALASGGQSPRDTLLLFTHEATYGNRTVGVGGELSNKQLHDWDPCRRTKPQPRQMYDVTGLPADDSLEDPTRLTLTHRSQPGEPPVWGRLADAGSAQARRMLDAEALPGRIIEPPFSPEDAPVGPLTRDRVLGIPHAIARTPRGAAWARQSSIPPVDPVDIVLPAHEHATVTLLIRDGVEVNAVGLVEGAPATAPLQLTPVGESFALEGLLGDTPPAGAHWQVYTASPPAPVDAIRLYAISGPSSPSAGRSTTAPTAPIPDALEPMAASLLSVELRFGTGPGTGNGELEAVTDLYSDLVSKTLAGEPDPSILEPDTTYTLTATITAHHAEQWGEDPIEIGDVAGSFPHTFTFRTATKLPTDLRGTSTPDRTQDDWDVCTIPDGAYPSYYAADVDLLFRDTALLSVYEAHGRALALRLVNQDGEDQFDVATTVERRASDLPAEQAAWREKLSSLHCVTDDTDELWREATASIPSLLTAKNRYTATLHAVNENASLESVAWDDAPAVYRWRFSTSRWIDAGAHLDAHQPIDELTDVLADSGTLEAAVATVATDDVTDSDVTIADQALDELVHDTLGLPPRRPPESPEAIRVWQWNADTDDATPVALLLDGPEPLLREQTTLTVRQGGQVIAGHVVTGAAGARVLFVPDGGEFAPGQAVELELEVTDQPIDPQKVATSKTYTTSLALPTRPPVLATDGGQS